MDSGNLAFLIYCLQVCCCNVVAFFVSKISNGISTDLLLKKFDSSKRTRNFAPVYNQ